DDAIELLDPAGDALGPRARLDEPRVAGLAGIRQRLDGTRVGRANRIDHGGQHHPLYKRRMEGRIPVTLQGFPEPDPDLLLDVGRVDAVVAEFVAVDQGSHLDAVVGEQLVQALAQGGIETHKLLFALRFLPNPRNASEIPLVLHAPLGVQAARTAFTPRCSAAAAPAARPARR